MTTRVSIPGGPYRLRDTQWTANRVQTLLVEDNPGVRLGGKLVLESSERGPFRVTACGTGREAMETLDQSSLDLHAVVRDFTFPTGMESPTSIGSANSDPPYP